MPYITLNEIRDLLEKWIRAKKSFDDFCDSVYGQLIIPKGYDQLKIDKQRSFVKLDNIIQNNPGLLNGEIFDINVEEIRALRIFQRRKIIWQELNTFTPCDGKYDIRRRDRYTLFKWLFEVIVTKTSSIKLPDVDIDESHIELADNSYEVCKNKDTYCLKYHLHLPKEYWEFINNKWCLIDDTRINLNAYLKDTDGYSFDHTCQIKIKSNISLVPAVAKEFNKGGSEYKSVKDIFFKSAQPYIDFYEERNDIVIIKLSIS